ncbi:MAG: sulfite exporter TauE/SafE family protein [Chloroflexi bacterium AL-W]|nr:sulfite exporter TauE/SafE family protein [Chloroflexi bacterium AL-N1]NOK65257.1 sulfite exporter TauE/SafE family protein [Chloroflexi bacterium AL-N10]NOK72478.1 sulfite exporter TauE/SafE family protein [Chloroflexi bacterium AL-N5]NOK79436.1 sulfite exporter TauE/SafE family protein [Chloroflexi bacterium AL-W]NOK87352.1 sulfite exporter TauE/SafE family protein [Chloroflexi bacterium AL-N15]
MLIDVSTLWLIMAIFFITSFVRASVGFGDALMAMPLLSLVVGIQTATPLFALVGVSISYVILARSWRHVDIRSAWRLILASFVGIPFGLYWLTNIPEEVVTTILGVGVMFFGLYNLFAPPLPLLLGERWGYAFGFFAGILGGAYNTNGPPIVVYGTLKRWDPEQFRSTLQAYFAFAGLMILAAHGLAGLWTQQIVQTYLFIMPAAISAIVLGSKASRYIPVPLFRRIIYGVLICVGFFLII